MRLDPALLLSTNLRRELLAVLAVHVARNHDESATAFASRVRELVFDREPEVHCALAPFGLRRLSRPDAMEWFAFND